MKLSRTSARVAATAAKCLVLAATLAAGSAQSALLTVSPGNSGSWTFYKTDSSGVFGTGTGEAEFVNGPASPPYGTGSAHLATGPGQGDGSSQIRTTAHAGTRIDALTALSYSTYATSFNGAQLPYLTLWIDNDNNGSVDDRLFFEPEYSNGGYGNPAPSQGAVALNVWQTWNALTGAWWTQNGEFGPGADARTLNAYLLLHPDATIVNPSGSVGGIRFAAGFASDSDFFNTYVDGFTIATAAGSTTYNFELQDAVAVPEPGSLSLTAGMLLTLLAIRRRRV